ncbi:MAG: hypothetical protein JKP96_08545 [Oceanicaulis sp.]|jgi:hypothetical protein|nr:hypothetical protein [Oceanicaulis sp.]
MDDEEVERFLSEFSTDLRNSPFTDLADRDVFRDVEMDEGEMEPRRPRDPRKEAWLMLSALKTQIALYHQDTFKKALSRLNEGLSEGEVQGAAIMGEPREGIRESGDEIEEGFDFSNLPDMSGTLAELDELIEIVTSRPERSE